MNALAPTNGVWDGRRHVYPVRVYYEDTDAAGIVYHANYFRFAERARTEMLRSLGVELSLAPDTHGVIFVVHSGDMKFMRPAKLDDSLTVETVMSELGAASLMARHTVRRADDDIFICNLKLASINGDGRSARMPDALRTKLATLIE